MRLFRLLQIGGIANGGQAGAGALVPAIVQRRRLVIEECSGGVAMDFEDEYPLVLQPERAPEDGGVHHDQIVGRAAFDDRRDLPTADGKQDDLIGLFGGSTLLVGLASPTKASWMFKRFIPAPPHHARHADRADHWWLAVSLANGGTAVVVGSYMDRQDGRFVSGRGWVAPYRGEWPPYGP